MSPESAEMTKYAANAMLATKISFINEMANLCDRLGADINDVRRGIGHDARIGFQFLFPGPGYGGSCFPKDVRAIIWAWPGAGPAAATCRRRWTGSTRRRSRCCSRRSSRHYGGDLKGKTLAVWGLAFKPRTDDIREAPALALIDAMLAAGVRSGCTTRRRWPTSGPSTATSSSTATGRTGRSRGRTGWPS